MPPVQSVVLKHWPGAKVVVTAAIVGGAVVGALVGALVGAVVANIFRESV